MKTKSKEIILQASRGVSLSLRITLQLQITSTELSLSKKTPFTRKLELENQWTAHQLIEYKLQIRVDFKTKDINKNFQLTTKNSLEEYDKTGIPIYRTVVQEEKNLTGPQKKTILINEWLINPTQLCKFQLSGINTLKTS